MYSVHKQFPTLEKDLAESERETASETGNEVNRAKDGKRGSAEEIELKSLQVETQDVGRQQETGAVETDPQETGAVETDPQETGAVETDPQETGAEETDPQETGAVETDPQETGAVETDPQETGAEETDPQETGAEETDPQETDDYYFQDPSSVGKFPIT